MSLLLDTHAFLWWRDDDARLGASARGAIAEAPRVFVSVASAWEVAIKIDLGRLTLAGRFEEHLGDFEVLPVGLRHTDAIRALPHHHRDPFQAPRGLSRLRMCPAARGGGPARPSSRS